MRRPHRGFTLVELMVTIAILGILAAIAMPAFMQYMKKSKVSEADLALESMTTKAKVYHLSHNAFPPTVNAILPTVSACASGTGKTVALPQSTWQADPGFGPLEFHQDEPGYFQFAWFNLGTGIAFAQGDLDCDGSIGFKYRMLIPAGGNVTTQHLDFMFFD